MVAHALAEQLRKKHPSIQVAVTGSIPLIYAMMETAQRDAITLVPIMYLVLLVAMFLFLRSLRAVLALLVMVGLAAATAMGAAGWLGIPLSPPMGSATTIILTIAVADGVHILVILADYMRNGMDRRAAMIESLAVNWQPALLTTVTTIIGFMSLNFAGIPPFHDLGNVAAIGVGAAWVLAVTLLPAFIAIVPYKVRPRGRTRNLSMDSFAEWLIRYRRRILPTTVGFSVLCAAFIPLIEFDDSFIEFFDKFVPFRADSEFAIENISGIYQLHFSLGAGQDGGVSDPKFLAAVDDFAVWLRSQPEVDHVASLSDIMKRLNRNMHGDEPDFYRLPENQALAAQYLLLYEMSLPYGLDLNNQIDIHKSATRVTATVKNLSATELRAVNDRAVAWFEANAEPSMHGSAASAAFMLANLSRRSIDSKVRGTSIAFGLIALILMFSLHSLRIGLLSLVPNIVAIVIAYGSWALLVGKIGMIFAIVTASSLGIIVDATVHFMSKYMRARRVERATHEDAVRYAMATVGTALLTTFLILSKRSDSIDLRTFDPSGTISYFVFKALNRSP
ncbi:MAG: putative RND superfamily exporter protein [Gammaproteobacteria bacterium]